MCISPLHEPKYTEFPWLTLGPTTHIPDINWKKWLSLCYGHVYGPFIIWTTERSPFQSSFALFHLPFHCKFFLVSGKFFWTLWEPVSPKHLAHLPDGIYRATSPILKSNDMFMLAKKNEKCQNVHTLVPPSWITLFNHSESWFSLKFLIFIFPKWICLGTIIIEKCHNSGRKHRKR